MAEEITKDTLVEREREAWQEVVRRLEFTSELVSAKTDKVLVKDAAAKLNDAIEKFKPIFKQRIQVEFGRA